jgi:CubicO group peptidase (beta-lactamase class C family)
MRNALLTFVVLVPGLLHAQDRRSTRVDSLFTSFVDARTPGCAVGVVDNGALVQARGFGIANLDYDVPIDSRSVFYLASVSKQFTAFAVALAAQEGKLSLDDDIRRFIPEFPQYGSKVTIRHLVHHTSGVRDYLTLIPLSGRNPADAMTDDALLGLVVRQKALNFTPGSEHLYSNTGYVLLAEIIKRATGMSLARYADEKMFKPLGMRDTHFHDDASIVVPRRVIGYTRTPDRTWRINHWFVFDKVGDGGLYSTIEDLAKWEANFYSGQVGGAAIRDQLLQRGVLTNGDTIAYAFGISHNTQRGLKVLGHSGSLAGFRTAIVRYPDQRLSVITLCNTTAASPMLLSQRAGEVYLADRMNAADAGPGGGNFQNAAPAPQTTPVSGRDGDAFVGSYRSEELDAVYELVIESDQLVLKRANGRIPVRRSSGDLLSAANLVLHIARDASGRVTGFTVDAGRVRGIRFDRQ